MALYLVDQASVGCYSVSIKFGRTVKITSLKNENFGLITAGATPTEVSAPFQIINMKTLLIDHTPFQSAKLTIAENKLHHIIEESYDTLLCL